LNEKQYVQVNQALFSLVHSYEIRMERNKRARAAGLRLSDCAVLTVLGQMEPLTASQLSASMAINPGTISLYVQRLVDKGLVERERDEKNRRLWWLTLTATGRDTYISIKKGTVQYTGDLLSPLSMSEQDILHRLLLKASHGLGFTWQ
jgi:DNA-binding MarR family transcriptional regulator